MTTFGERLRQLRLESGLSQRALAGEDLTTGYISLLERGARSPSTEVVQLLARRLGCSSTMLMTGEPSERDQLIDLELAYARLAIAHGESAEALPRLRRLLADDALPMRTRDELTLQLGTAHERCGDLVSAVEVLHELLERAARNESHLPVTFVAVSLLRCYLDSGDLHQAVTVGEAALKTADAQQLGGTEDYYRLAATVMDAYMGLGNYLQARRWVDRYLAHAAENGDAAGQAALYWNAAVLAEHEGRLGHALSLCERALGLYGELGTVRDTPRLQLDMAWLLLLDDPPQAARAAELLQRSGDALADLGSRVDRARWSWLSAAARLYRGDPAGAEPLARQAVELIATGGPVERAQALLVLADVYLAQGRTERAVEPLHGAFAALLDASGGRTTSFTWRELGERLARVGETSSAGEAFRRALDGAGIRGRTAAVAPQAPGSGDATVTGSLPAAAQQGTRA